LKTALVRARRHSGRKQRALKKEVVTEKLIKKRKFIVERKKGEQAFRGSSQANEQGGNRKSCHQKRREFERENRSSLGKNQKNRKSIVERAVAQRKSEKKKVRETVEKSDKEY